MASSAHVLPIELPNAVDTMGANDDDLRQREAQVAATERRLSETLTNLSGYANRVSEDLDALRNRASELIASGKSSPTLESLLHRLRDSGVSGPATEGVWQRSFQARLEALRSREQAIDELTRTAKDFRAAIDGLEGASDLSLAERRAGSTDLDATIAAWTRGRDARQVAEALQASGVPAAASLNATISVGQTNVKSNGQKNRITFFPRYADSVTSLKALLTTAVAVKSGANSPTRALISPSFSVLIGNPRASSVRQACPR